MTMKSQETKVWSCFCWGTENKSLFKAQIFQQKTKKRAEGQPYKSEIMMKSQETDTQSEFSLGTHIRSLIETRIFEQRAERVLNIKQTGIKS